MSFEQVVKGCIVGEIIFFNFVGIFGNIQLVWMTMRKRNIQSKSGILLATNAVCHLLCLLSELVNAIFVVFLSPFTRKQCFPFIALYIFMICQQSILTLAISLDLLAALLFPLWYRTYRTTPYVTAIFALCSLYSLSVLIWGSATQDNEVILFCNPPLALSRKPSRYWSISGVILNCLVLIVYIIIILYVKFRARCKACKDNRRVIRRLRVLVVIFVLSWFMCSLGIDMGHVLDFKTEVLAMWQSSMVFFALLCYSQTFYVCIWRSSEYRAAFKEQLLIMTCKMRQIHHDFSHSRSQGAGFLTAPTHEHCNDECGH